MKKNQSQDNRPLHQTVAEGFEFKVGAKSIAVEFTEQKLSAHAGSATFWAWLHGTRWGETLARQLPHRPPTSNNHLTPLAKALAASHGCGARLDYEPLCPPTVNTEEKVPVAVAAATELVGTANVGDVPLSTGGEDFSFMLQKKPGVFMRIGNGVDANGDFHNVHTPLYDFNDAILPLGAAYWVSLVREELGWAGEDRAAAA